MNGKLCLRVGVYGYARSKIWRLGSSFFSLPCSQLGRLAPAFGTLRSMGPGMLPMTLSVLSAGGGLLLITLSFLQDSDLLETWSVRGLFFIIGAIIIFAFTIQSCGLIVWIGNLMLLIINLPLVGMWVKLHAVHGRLRRVRLWAAEVRLRARAATRSSPNRKLNGDHFARLDEALRKALADDSTRNRLLNLGAVLPSEAEQTPVHLGTFVKAEIARWTPVLTGAK